MPENTPLDPLGTLSLKASLPSLATTLDGARHGEDSTNDQFQYGATATATNPPVISGYRLTEVIGQGGMGRVFAGRDLTLERNVAVKTLLPGADAERFVTEAKITARLPHPGIPPVHALGRLEDGSPYLAMKLIHGRTLADLLNERPSPGEDWPRLMTIFEQISQAVGFAHRCGIIHRDLKPANVMVGEFGEVQVMDWGLAKDLALPPHAESKTVESLGDSLQHTLAGEVMGTPGYMAPEQARGEPVDARADVFALGALLATILTGRPAFVGTTVKEVLERSAQGDTSEARARLAGCQADAELVSLAARCLAPRPADRPVDASVLSLEVAMYRSGVDARLRRAETQAAEAAVRVAEARKRQWVVMGTSSLIASLLVTGLVISLLLLNRATTAESAAIASAKEARDERDAKDVAFKAEEQAKLLAEQKRQEAETNLGFANKGNEILGSVFAGLDPKANYATVADLRNALKLNLQRAVRELEGAVIGDPLVVADMQSKLGASLFGLGEATLAIEMFEKARITYADKLGLDHENTLVVENNLASVYSQAGQFDKALPLLEEALRLREARHGSAHVNTAPIITSLAIAYQKSGQPEKALPLFKESVELKTDQFGPEHAETMKSVNNLAMAYKAAGQFAEALKLLENVLKVLAARHGSDHPDTLAVMDNVASCYQAAGNLDKALPLFEATLQRRLAQLGREHPDTMTSMNNLALGYLDAGQFSRAQPIFEEAHKLFSNKLGADHPTTLIAMSNLASTYRDAGQLDKALPLLEETLKIRKGKLSPDHPNILSSMNNLAMGYKAAKQYEKALPLLEETLKLQETKFGPEHPDTLTITKNLAATYRENRQFDKALPMLERVHKSKSAQLGPDHPGTLSCMNSLAASYRDSGRIDKALPIFEEALQLMTAKLGSDHPTTLNCLSNLGLCYVDARRFDKALPVLEEALQQRTIKLGRDHPDTLATLLNLGVGYKSAGQFDKALPLLEETLQLRTNKFGSAHRETLDARYHLGKTYSLAKQGSNAATHLLEYVQEKRKQYSAGEPSLAGFLLPIATDLLDCEQFAAAEPLLRECVAICEKSEPDLWSTYYICSQLGEALLGQKKQAEAEPFLVKGYEGLKQREKAIPSLAKVMLAKALDRLIAVYSALEQPDQVEKYQKLRREYPAVNMRNNN